MSWGAKRSVGSGLEAAAGLATAMATGLLSSTGFSAPWNSLDSSGCSQAESRAKALFK